MVIPHRATFFTFTHKGKIMFRKRLERRLQRRLDRAVKLGAMEQAEADEIMSEVPRMDWLMILEIIMMIIEIIREWLDNRSATEEAPA